MRTSILWIATAMLTMGCGYKAEIERLEGLLADTSMELTTRESTLQDRDATIAELTRDAAALQTELDQRIADLAAMESELDAEREKSARILADRGALRGEVEAMKDALADLAERKRLADARVQAYRDLVQRFQSLIDAGTLDVKIIDGRMVVVLKTDILFGSGSAELSTGGEEALAQVAEVLASLDRRYQVEGHTDNVPIATSRYPSNWFLAAARAIGVVDHLVASGLPAENVSAAAFGDTHPVAANDTPEGKAQNRRIEIVVVPDLSELPGYRELSDL